MLFLKFWYQDMYWILDKNSDDINFRKLFCWSREITVDLVLNSSRSWVPLVALSPGQPNPRAKLSWSTLRLHPRRARPVDWMINARRDKNSGYLCLWEVPCKRQVSDSTQDHFQKYCIKSCTVFGCQMMFNGWVVYRSTEDHLNTIW